MINFWPFSTVFVPISYFKLVFFWKGIMVNILLLLMLNLCQCLFNISFIFGSIGKF